MSVFAEREGFEWCKPSSRELRSQTKFGADYSDRDNHKGEKCRPRKVVASIASKFVVECSVEMFLQSNTPQQKRATENSVAHNLAEREGFEPPVQLPVHRISSAARSTTPAPFL